MMMMMMMMMMIIIIMAIMNAIAARSDEATYESVLLSFS